MLHVMVVHDDQGTRDTWCVALRHAGYDVRLAESASAAMAALSGRRDTHALLLDLNLGDMTGLDVLRWMRAEGVVVPTAVITAFRAAFDPDEAIALGATVYIDQPLSIDDILALVQSLAAPPSPHEDPGRLHTRFLKGEPGAVDDLVRLFLKVLPARLGRAFPRVPSDFVLDATTDACLEYSANPARFDPSRSASIVDFVYLIARRNLANRVRAEMALKNREMRYAREQALFLTPEPSRRAADVGLWATLAALTVDSRERRAAELWLDDAGNDAIAEALGVGDLAPDERRREAKRFKDRLVKRLTRYFRPPSGAGAGPYG